MPYIHLYIAALLLALGVVLMTWGMDGNWERLTPHNETLIRLGMWAMLGATIFLGIFIWIADGWRLG